VKRGTAMLALGGLFLAGLLVGAAATHLFYARKLLGPSGPSRAMVAMFHHRLERDLDLTAAQAEAVRDILRRSHVRAEDLRRDVFPQVRAIMDQAALEIEEVLDDEQRERFRELRRRHHWRSDAVLLGPPGGSHHRDRGRPPRP
jgi:hypothetical protein